MPWLEWLHQLSDPFTSPKHLFFFFDAFPCLQTSLSCCLFLPSVSSLGGEMLLCWTEVWWIVISSPLPCGGWYHNVSVNWYHRHPLLRIKVARLTVISGWKRWYTLSSLSITAMLASLWTRICRREQTASSTNCPVTQHEQKLAGFVCLSRSFQSFWWVGW